MNIYQNKIKKEIQGMAKYYGWTYKEAKEIYKWTKYDLSYDFGIDGTKVKYKRQEYFVTGNVREQSKQIFKICKKKSDLVIRGDKNGLALGLYDQLTSMGFHVISC